jgi:hypothetical protein
MEIVSRAGLLGLWRVVWEERCLWTGEVVRQ